MSKQDLEMEGGAIDAEDITLEELPYNFERFIFTDFSSVFFSGKENEVYEKLEFNMKQSMDLCNILQQCQLSKIYLDNILTDTQKALIHFNTNNLISKPEEIKLDEQYMHHLVAEAIKQEHFHTKIHPNTNKADFERLNSASPPRTPIIRVSSVSAGYLS